MPTISTVSQQVRLSLRIESTGLYARGQDGGIAAFDPSMTMLGAGAAIGFWADPRSLVAGQQCGRGEGPVRKQCKRAQRRLQEADLPPCRSASLSPCFPKATGAQVTKGS